MYENVKRIIILGCGGHAKSVCDTLLTLPKQYEVAGFVDCVKNENFSYEGVKVIGMDNDLQMIYDQGICHAALGIGFLGKGDVRNRLAEKLQEIGFLFPVIVDPTAIVAETAEIGEGTFVGKRAVVNVDVRIGKHCIINSCSLIEHDCHIGDFTHIAVSACVCGGVNVGRECLVGANATIIQGMAVSDYNIIPAGAVIRPRREPKKEDRIMEKRQNTRGGGYNQIP